MYVGLCTLGGANATCLDLFIYLIDLVFVFSRREAYKSFSLRCGERAWHGHE